MPRTIQDSLYELNKCAPAYWFNTGVKDAYTWVNQYLPLLQITHTKLKTKKSNPFDEEVVRTLNQYISGL